MVKLYFPYSFEEGKHMKIVIVWDKKLLHTAEVVSDKLQLQEKYVIN